MQYTASANKSKGSNDNRQSDLFLMQQVTRQVCNINGAGKMEQAQEEQQIRDTTTPQENVPVLLKGRYHK
jgi:hypothetical protein